MTLQIQAGGKTSHQEPLVVFRFQPPRIESLPEQDRQEHRAENKNLYVGLEDLRRAGWIPIQGTRPVWDNLWKVVLRLPMILRHDHTAAPMAGGSLVLPQPRF